jgi:putative PIN family toxin of toxin-antitoxin system
VKLVLDTNVVIDWLVFDDPFLAAFRRSVLDARVIIVTHEPALAELRRVLGYPELRLTAERQASVLARYEAQTEMLAAFTDPLPERFPECRDPDDDPFLALAWHAKAYALVSRDKRVLKLAKRARKFGFNVLTVPQLAELVEDASFSSQPSSQPPGD